MFKLIKYQHEKVISSLKRRKAPGCVESATTRRKIIRSRQKECRRWLDLLPAQFFPWEILKAVLWCLHRNNCSIPDFWCFKHNFFTQTPFLPITSTEELQCCTNQKKYPKKPHQETPSIPKKPKICRSKGRAWGSRRAFKQLPKRGSDIIKAISALACSLQLSLPPNS